MSERAWCKKPDCNSDYCQLQQARGTLSLAEEGLANYAQENERLKSEILEARRVGRPPKALWLQEPQTPVT